MRWYDRCIGSLLGSEIPIKIIVIDNASSDNSVKYIKEKFPQVLLFESKTNLGFTKSNNIAIKYALENNADYIFLLNQDAWIEVNSLTNLLKTFNLNQKVGIASPLHINEKETSLDMYFASNMTWQFVSDAFFKKIADLYEVPFINAAAWLISTECIRKVGGFDTSLFVHSGEDSNYCQRVIYHGFKILINTNAKVYHDKTITVQDFLSHDDYVMQEGNRNFVRKITEANILENKNIPGIIRNIKRKIAINAIFLRYRKVKILRNEISFLKSINKSRYLNKVGGLVWLE